MPQNTWRLLAHGVKTERYTLTQSVLRRHRLETDRAVPADKNKRWTQNAQLAIINGVASGTLAARSRGEIALWIMVEFLTSTTAQLVYLTALLAAVIAVGWYIMLKFRDFDDDEPVGTSKLMTTFRDLYDEGGLSDEEYRTIKSKLTEQMQAELRQTEKTGSDDSGV